MLGSRALYHDGWKAVAFHTPPFINYDGTDTRRPFDDDAWELYHVAEDFAEVHDLAADRPDKLAEMQERWWAEAAKYQVLPLNNEPGRFGDTRYRRDHYELYGGIGPLPEAIAPNFRNRSFTIAAELDIPASGDADGVVVAHGSHAGGYVAYVHARRLHYAYNFVGTEITTIAATADLPTGPVVARVVFTRASGDRGGNVELFYDGVPVGAGRVERTTLLTYGTPGFAVGYQPHSPIVAALTGRAEIPPGVLRRVVIDTRGRDPDPRSGSARRSRHAVTPARKAGERGSFDHSRARARSGRRSAASTRSATRRRRRRGRRAGRKATPFLSSVRSSRG